MASGTSLAAGYYVSTSNFALINFGTIGHSGVYVHGTSDTVINAGTITGTTNGIVFASAGLLTNQSGGAISSSGGNGVGFDQGGRVVNRAYAVISGGYHGVATYNAAGTVVNAGTIAGGAFGAAVRLPAGAANRVVVYPGAVFTGGVSGGGNATLELASGYAIGAISSIGSKYTGFSQVTVDPSAFWYFSGSKALTGGTLLDGGVLFNGGTLDSTVTITGTDKLINDPGKSVTAATAVLIADAGG